MVLLNSGVRLRGVAVEDGSNCRPLDALLQAEGVETLSDPVQAGDGAQIELQPGFLGDDRRHGEGTDPRLREHSHEGEVVELANHERV